MYFNVVPKIDDRLIDAEIAESDNELGELLVPGPIIRVNEQEVCQQIVLQYLIYTTCH